ncbi:MAG: hypothetical protein LBC61_01930 [Candidatus Peribacteria bacterium]|jgi:hypothetical protein|nr:hypothetical protein [Candidatus Peribacteria bacterium]
MNIENTFRAAVLALPLALSGCNDNNKGDVEKVVPTYTDTVAALIQE